MSTRNDLLDLLDPDLLWLIQEERADPDETDLEVEEAYREIADAIMNGIPLHASDLGDLGEEYEAYECDV